VAADLIQNNQTSGSSSVVQGEGSFVLRKLSWAMQGMMSAPTIGGSGCSQTLTTTRGGAAVTTQARRAGSAIQISEDNGTTWSGISTSNVSATCLQFATIAGVGSGPSGVTATLTLSGKTFTMTRYVRK